MSQPSQHLAPQHALDTSARSIRLNITSHPANLAPARRAVEDLAIAGGFNEAACGEIALCVNEALANITRHAYAGATDRPIELTAELDDRVGLRIRIRDWGNGINPDDLPVPKRDPMTPGGLGLICLRRMMDKVIFMPQSDGMLVEMTRRKRRPALWLIELIRNWRR